MDLIHKIMKNLISKIYDQRSKINNLGSLIYRALKGLKQLTDPSVEGSPYRTNRLGRRGFI